MREEARVDQVQNRVLDAADVVVDRAPVRDLRGSNGAWSLSRVGVAVEVPRRIDERVHRVGLAAGRAAALRARGVDELGHAAPAANRRAGELRRSSAAPPAALVRHRHHAALRRSGSSGSACPSSAGARCPSPSAGIAPCLRRSRALPRRPSSRRSRLREVRPLYGPEFTEHAVLRHRPRSSLARRRAPLRRAG